MKNTFALLLVLAATDLVFGSAYINDACTNRGVANAFVYNGFCAFEWVTNLTYPRAMRVASNNDVLLTDYQTSSLYVLWENADGSVNQATLVGAGIGLNHGLEINGGYLYASSSSNVYRWPYVPGDRSLLSGIQTVINGIPHCCDHVTRALEFDAHGLLYVQVGSGSNVDPNSSSAQIRRFNITNIPSGGIPWSTGFVYADGLRNEVGIRFDPHGTLWGVENGRDDLYRADLGDVHEQNPAEELNKFAVPGKFYGYPYCWTEYNITSTPEYPKGTQWADLQYFPNTTYTDAWCRNTNNVVTPAYSFDGHKAPLDLIFNSGPTAFKVLPAANAFVAFHGSTHRSTYVGYSVSMIKMTNNNPVAEIPFFQFAGPGAKGPGWPYRPVGLAWYKCHGVYHCLLVSSGGGVTNNVQTSGGSIIAIIYKNQA